MKKLFTPLRLAALTGLALAASIGMGQAQTFTQGSTYTQSFDVGANTTNFSGSGSVASWIYWFNTPGGNTPMTNDVSLDVGNSPTSGSLVLLAPYITLTNQLQDVVFGTFGNQFGYDTGTTGDMSSYTNINFFIRADPTTTPRNVGGTNLDYGTIDVGFFYPYSFEVEGSVTIPLSASNAWVHLAVPVNLSSSVLTGIAGIAFRYGNLPTGSTNYPGQLNQVFYLDNVQVLIGVAPPPPTLSQPVVPVSGFNAIATTPGVNGQYNRTQLCTVGSTGYTFFGQTSATYSWNIKSFPTLTGGNFQQHFFLIGGIPGQFDQAADYNLADVFWITVQQSDTGVATANFRLKTNEASGNAMLFNTNSPTDVVNNPNGWPVEPIAALNDANGAVGTWTVNVAGGTSITITSPTGLTTNFSITPAQAALFADPVSMLLGGQPNNPNGAGKAVVYSSFSASGVGSPFTDNFLAESAFNTNIWRLNESSDTNGTYLVPGNAAFWVPWSIPDVGYSLQDKASLSTVGGWTLPSVPIIRNNGHDQALLTTAQLPSAGQGYFELVQFTFSALQVLFDGQTNAPGTVLGYTGSPTPIVGAEGAGAIANTTINAVDSQFHIVTGIVDIVHLVSSADPNATEPLDTALVNGTLTEQVIFSAVGNWTVTASDVSDPTKTAGVSAQISVGP